MEMAPFFNMGENPVGVTLLKNKKSHQHPIIKTKSNLFEESITHFTHVKIAG
jgi:hypothetical protein